MMRDPGLKSLKIDVLTWEHLTATFFPKSNVTTTAMGRRSSQWYVRQQKAELAIRTRWNSAAVRTFEPRIVLTKQHWFNLKCTNMKQRQEIKHLHAELALQEKENESKVELTVKDAVTPLILENRRQEILRQELEKEV